MTRFKFILSGIFLAIILFACNNSKTASNTPTPTAKANVATTNPAKKIAPKTQKKTPVSDAKAVRKRCNNKIGRELLY